MSLCDTSQWVIPVQYVTGFAKPSHSTQELKSNPMFNINNIPMHALSRNIKFVAIDSQIYFHRWLSADPVKLPWCITGPLEHLGSTNQNWCSVKLLPVSVSSSPVDCVHLCRLLAAWGHGLCPIYIANGRVGTPLACPPSPTTPYPPPTPLHVTPMILQGL